MVRRHRSHVEAGDDQAVGQVGVVGNAALAEAKRTAVSTNTKKRYLRGATELTRRFRPSQQNGMAELFSASIPS
jgi:hypothetical protein